MFAEDPESCQLSRWALDIEINNSEGLVQRKGILARQRCFVRSAFLGSHSVHLKITISAV